jgi:hypothetical protein
VCPLDVECYNDSFRTDRFIMSGDDAAVKRY